MKKENEVSCSTCNARYLENKKSNINKNRKSNFYEECQSCGLSLLKDIGREHMYYCSNCWSKGDFIELDISLKEQKENNYTFLKEKEYSLKEIKSINKKLRKFERWKKH